MIDLYQSRRTKFIKCKYWSQIRDEKVVKLSEIAYYRKPTGFFDAEETGAYTEENQTVEGTFMLQKDVVSIETVDDVRDLKMNDIVEFNGDLYRVTDIQREVKKKQAQYMNEYQSIKTFISLMR